MSRSWSDGSSEETALPHDQAHGCSADQSSANALEEVELSTKILARTESVDEAGSREVEMDPGPDDLIASGQLRWRFFVRFGFAVGCPEGLKQFLLGVGITHFVQTLAALLEILLFLKQYFKKDPQNGPEGVSYLGCFSFCAAVALLTLLIWGSFVVFNDASDACKDTDLHTGTSVFLITWYVGSCIGAAILAVAFPKSK